MDNKNSSGASYPLPPAASSSAFMGPAVGNPTKQTNYYCANCLAQQSLEDGILCTTCLDATTQSVVYYKKRTVATTYSTL